MYPALTNAAFLMSNCNARLEVDGVDYLLGGGVVANAFVLTGGADGTGTVSWAGGILDLGIGYETNRGDILVERGTRLLTTNTPILCRNLSVKNGASMTFGGSASPCMTNRNGNNGSLAIETGGSVWLGKGSIVTRNNSISVRNGNTTYGRSSLILDGVTMPNIAIQMQNTSSGLGSLLEIRSGESVSLGSVIIGRQATTEFLDEMRVMGGNVTCSSTIKVGSDSGTGGRAHGRYTQTGGNLACTTLYVGSHSGQRGGGYYTLSEGTNTVQVLQFYTDDDASTADDYGTRQFVASSNATLRFTGAGMLATGTNAWLIDFAPATNLFDTTGALVFAPDSGVVTQQLLAFARDAGADATMFASNTAIGTLDLSALAPPKLLWIAAASNEAINAAYVRTLAGLTAAEAGTLVDSPLNIYYAADLNPDMLDQPSRSRAAATSSRSEQRRRREQSSSSAERNPEDQKDYP